LARCLQIIINGPDYNLFKSGAHLLQLRKNTSVRKKMIHLKILLLSISFGVLGSYPAHGENADYDSLESCISLYKNGEYDKTIECLTLMQSYPLDDNDWMTVFKYLGFSYGMLGRIDQAKKSFNSALNMDPEMQIDTLETPPNISVIFNQVKLERKIAQINYAKPVERVEVTQKKSLFVPVLLLTLGVTSAGAGIYYLSSGNTFHDKYHTVTVPDQGLMDHYYSNYKNAYIKSAVFLGLSAIVMPISTYLFLRKAPIGKHISLSDTHGSVSLSYSF
jgi:tetratricopeptide (TPR) repeat protein